ncbi:type II toxin-antitoxin system RelE/ParE family toxin [Fluviibacter sp.]
MNSLDGIFLAGYIATMAWEIEYTDEFGDWWSGLSEEEQVSLAASVELLEERGPNLGFPHSSGINGSKHTHMRELRTQHSGRPFRTLYAFDPRRNAILLLGGDKTGDDRWYEVNVPIADRLYDEHLEELRKEGLIDD